MRRELKNQKGQAAIEFIACMVVIFFFLLFYLSLTIVLVTSEYVDYATFMAARTYKSAYGSRASQETNAKIVFDSYAEKVQGIARNWSLNYSNTDPNNEHTGGIEVSYDMDLFYLPPLFVLGQSTPSKIRLTAEAHLGRDPGFQDCLDFFEGFVNNLGLDGMQGLTEEMDDNGC